MSNPTVKPPRLRPGQRSRAGQKPRSARRPGLRLSSIRRDAQPLIFGWGKDLTRLQRERLQRFAAWGFGGAISLLVLGIFGFSILQQVWVIPHSPLVTVNGVAISQDDYRRLLAYTAQDEWNVLQSELSKYNDLTEKQLRGDTSVNNGVAALTSQLQVATQDFRQANITQHVADMAIENELIKSGSARFIKAHADATKQLTPTADLVNARVNAFKAAFPKGETYSDFLSKNAMSDDDVRTAATMYVRRDMMQAYLAAQYTSPINQAHLRRIELGDRATADKILNQLKSQGLLDAGKSWNDITKASSLDVDSKNKGGDLGFIAPGTNDAGIERWVFDASRKVGDISVVATSGGTFDIVQALEFAQKPMTDAQVQAAKGNALNHWISGERVAPGNKVSAADTAAMQATRNLPHTPDLNAKLPSFNPQVPTAGG